MSGLTWQKSTFSSSNGNSECVELASVCNSLLLRESDEAEMVLTAGISRFAGLLGAVKTGRFDDLRR
jgi:hypothetical protein